MRFTATIQAIEQWTESIRDGSRSIDNDRGQTPITKVVITDEKEFRMTVRDPPLARPQTFDVLLIDPDLQRLWNTRRRMEADMPLRVACKTSSRAATESFKTARFDVVVCRADLGDIPAHPWIEMIRVGQFGYGSTPVIMLCDDIEFEQLGPMIDYETTLVREDDHQGLMQALRAIADSTDKTAVLVIEDEQQAAEAVQRAIEKYYSVDVAHDGDWGLKLWEARRHPIVVLDLMLPALSGAEVLERMLRDDPEQIVIVLTAFDTPQTHQALILAGAVKFVSKNGDLHALPEICARALRAKKCMSNVKRSRADAAAMAEVAVQIHAAQYHIEQGQTAHGLQHVRLAAFGTRKAQLTDDQMARVWSTSTALPD